MERAELDYNLSKENGRTTTSPSEGAWRVSGQTGVIGMKLRVCLGGVFFIRIFLSIVFMMGTVLVIYYKQISGVTKAVILHHPAESRLRRAAD